MPPCLPCAFVIDGDIHPSIRTWNGSDCSTEHIRDENAAGNGLIKILPATSLVRWVKEDPKK
ncbi:hypothetical protein H0W26_04885 [Candidatus Dependentiae bacterium]|nr:hypothetical protein [Candidatus Dependentiae bacterium]